MKIKIIYNPKCAEYVHKPRKKSQMPDIPYDTPNRVRRPAEFLKEKGYEFIEPKPAKEEDLLTVHTQNLINRVKSGEEGYNLPNENGRMFEPALISAGAALEAVNYIGENTACFVLTRPPGHHAEKNFIGGLSYSNNIAIAIQKARKIYKRVAILDIDLHESNGVRDIFANDENILSISLHSPVWVVPTNKVYENYRGFYVPPKKTKSIRRLFKYIYSVGSENLSQEDKIKLRETIKKDFRKHFMKTLKKSIKIIKEFNSDLVAVPAGFDTYENDPVGVDGGLKNEDYFKVGKMISSLEKPVISTFEGGYSEDLPILIHNYIRGLSE